MALLVAWAPKLLFILGILIVWLAVLRYRSHQRNDARRREAEWREHHEWLHGDNKPRDKA